MDKEGFRKYLKKEGKSTHSIEAITTNVAEFEHFLEERRNGKKLEAAKPEDLDAFISWVEKDEANAAKKFLLSIRYFFESVPNSEVADLASFRWNERVSDSQASMKLKEFRGINPEHVKKLESAGVRNIKDMIAVGPTPAARKELAEKTGVPLSAILELVKLSDLARIQGVKGIRARLYYDAGVDMIDKLAKWDSEKLRMMLVKFVEKSKFDGIAPLPKEARNTVEMAKRMPRIVEY